MNKILAVFLSLTLSTALVFAGQDRFSQEYLQSKNHFSITKPVAEKIVKRIMKKSLKKDTGANFDIKFDGYTTSSIKKGIFKHLEITGEDLTIDNIPVAYLNLKTLTDYNYIDYKKKPIEFKSDMVYAYSMLITDEAINKALQDAKYQKTINKINKIAFSLFIVKNVRTKIINNRMFIVVDYNFPIIKSSKDRSFVSSCEFQVLEGKIIAKDVKIDSVYGNIPLDKVANLINILNPLEFTLNLIETQECKGNIENVNIIDNKVQVDGKIYIKKGE